MSYSYPNDPFSFGSTKQMQDRIKRDKEEFKAEEIKKDEGESGKI